MAKGTDKNATDAEKTDRPEAPGTDPRDMDAPGAETPEADKPGPDTDAECETADPDTAAADPVKDTDATADQADIDAAATDATDTPPRDPVRDAPPPDSTAAPDRANGGGGGAGVGAMLLGGVVAAALGFGAAQYANDGWPFTGEAAPDGFRQETRDALAAQQSRVDDLATRLDAVPTAKSLDAVRGTAANAAENALSIQNDLSALTDRLGGIDDRLMTLEKRPISEGVSDAAIAAYEAELQKLQETMAAQRTEVESIIGEAQQMEENAAETARRTMAQSAATRIVTAIEAGDPFAAAVADLRDAGVEVPAALSDTAEEGVSTRTALAEDFPDAARAALAATRDDAGSEAGSGGLSGFLRNQLGARSVTPREGDDPDAILSRAEAAVEEGRIAAALTEIEGLPQTARDTMSGWIDAATKRRDAKQAAETLAQSPTE